MGDTRNIAVVGGGIAGLAAARVLIDRGHRVTVFDKGRGPGGRASTRRSEHGAFDHGAQYFTARDPGFAATVDAWRAVGVAAPWNGRFGTIRSGVFGPDRPKERLVGVPGMNAVVRAMGEGIEIRYGTRVDAIGRSGRGWSLRFGDGASQADFDAVIVAVPSVQAAALLQEPAPELAAVARTAEMDPCWTVMAAFESRIDVPFDGAKIEAGISPHDTPLGWIARDSSKPGRAAERGDRWVLQASPRWSAAHLEHDPQWALGAMLDALRGLIGNVPAPSHASAHRWRYASVREPVGTPCLTDGLSLAVCGDWLLHARIEAAWLSGTAAGRAISGRSAGRT